MRVCLCLYALVCICVRSRKWNHILKALTSKRVREIKKNALRQQMELDRQHWSSVSAVPNQFTVGFSPQFKSPWVTVLVSRQKFKKDNCNLPELLELLRQLNANFFCCQTVF